MLVNLKSKTTFAVRNFPNIKIHSSLYRSIYDICLLWVTEKEKMVYKNFLTGHFWLYEYKINGTF